jgi:hypothetical protein
MQKRHLVAMAFIAFLLTRSGLADESTTASHLPNERFNLRASGFFAQSIDTRIRLDGHLNAGGQEWDFGTTIDMADQLNLETSVNVFRAEAMWDFGNAHRINLAWFDMEERGQIKLADMIDFGDTDFAAGLTVDSYFRTNILRMAYTYFFIQKPRLQLGASLGIHVMKVAAGVGVVNTSATEDTGITAPLPVLGMSLDFALTNRVLLRAHGEYLTVSYDDYAGELIDLYGAIEWRVNNNWSFGTGIEYFDIDVVTTREHLRLEVQHDWIGYQAYFSFRF